MLTVFHPAKAPIRAVLFDMDGLLVDSERLAQQCCLDLCRDMGHPITMDTSRRMLGATHVECVRILREAIPGFDEEAYFSRSKPLLWRLLETSLAAKPGAHALAGLLRQRQMPYAIASSSSEERVRVSLDSTGLSALFPVRITGDHGLPSKPAPDLFLAAADLLGIAPQNCLVLEDSPKGVQAGRAAGCTVCMIPDLVPFSEALAPYCDMLCDSLEDVPQLLAGFSDENN